MKTNPPDANKQERLDAYEAARIYWEELSFGDRNYTAVATRLRRGGSGKERDKVGRVIRAWEQRGNVIHRVLRDNDQLTVAGAYPSLMPNLEDRIRRKFALRDAIVVDISNLARPSEPPNGDQWLKRDDAIHQLLGAWAGRTLAALSRNNDRVAVGGGRGPYYATQHCILPEQSCVSRPQKIVSLSGSMGTRLWDTTRDGMEGLLDPDEIAKRLSRRLGVSNCSLLDCPITEKENGPYLLEITMGLTLIMIGIGAWGGGHRLTRIGPDTPELQKVGALVNRINKLIRRNCKKSVLW
jgi:DNA-binding transcriptional regulator LsrR (DeoR family)